MNLQSTTIAGYCLWLFRALDGLVAFVAGSVARALAKGTVHHPDAITGALEGFLVENQTEPRLIGRGRKYVSVAQEDGAAVSETVGRVFNPHRTYQQRKWAGYVAWPCCLFRSRLAGSIPLNVGKDCQTPAVSALPYRYSATVGFCYGR